MFCLVPLILELEIEIGYPGPRQRNKRKVCVSFPALSLFLFLITPSHAFRQFQPSQILMRGICQPFWLLPQLCHLNPAVLSRACREATSSYWVSPVQGEGWVRWGYFRALMGLPWTTGHRLDIRKYLLPSLYSPRPSAIGEPITGRNPYLLTLHSKPGPVLGTLYTRSYFHYRTQCFMVCKAFSLPTFMTSLWESRIDFIFILWMGE